MYFISNCAGKVVYQEKTKQPKILKECDYAVVVVTSFLKYGDMSMSLEFQDDYLDCYGDPEVIGKIGTDIEDNKCGWLIVQALKKANKQQLQVLKVCYIYL